jgi:serine phosphatase RsbU (regulator of sigma subunit)
MILTSGIWSILRGYKAARYFVFGWSIFITGILLLLFRSLGILPSNFLTTYTMQIGSLFELVFLSLALADKYKNILEENNLVQGELLQSQIKQNETLEAKVQERTILLNQSLSFIKQDLAVAKKIQQNTLMINYHLIEELEIIPFYLAMSEVGGDFYGINKVTDNKYRLFLADATGHGIQAALITMAIKGIYDNIKNYDLSIQQLMEIFNDEYVQKYGSLNTYLTCIIVDIDIENELLEVTSAGHPSCLLIHNDGTISFPKTGRMIGIVKGTQYDSFQFQFVPGNRLYLFTDGIFEEFNSAEEEFGEERLYSILRNSMNLSIEKSIHEVINQLEMFLGGRAKQDDITILGVGFKNLLLPLV